MLTNIYDQPWLKDFESAMNNLEDRPLHQDFESANNEQPRTGLNILSAG
jgi:hypothetical protein